MNIQSRAHSKNILRHHFGPLTAYYFLPIFGHYQSSVINFKDLFYRLASLISVKVKNLRRVVATQHSHFFKRGEGFVMSP